MTNIGGGKSWTWITLNFGQSISEKGPAKEKVLWESFKMFQYQEDIFDRCDFDLSPPPPHHYFALSIFPSKGRLEGEGAESF